MAAAGPVSYDGRRFRPVSNTPNGQVNGETLFLYRQDGTLLTATYQGGGIRHGSMTGLVDSATGAVRFCYQRVTDSGELRAGVCESSPVWLPDGRLRLEERWQWTLGGEGRGESAVEEEDPTTARPI